MIRRLTPIASLALAGAILAPAAMAHAARPSVTGQAVTLRYRYVAGQTYSYNLAVKARARLAGAASLAGSGSVSSTTGTIRYHLVRVDPKGVATADITTSALRVKVTVNGQTRTVTAPSTTQRAYLGADGSQRTSAGSTIGAVGIQSLGSLPPGNGSATVGGPSWSSKAKVTLPSSLGAALPPFQVTTTYTLTAVNPVGGSTIATINGSNSNANAPFKINTTIQGTSVSLQLRETTMATTLFDVTAGRLASSTAHQVLHLTIGQGGATKGNAGSGTTVSEDITTDTSVTRV